LNFFSKSAYLALFDEKLALPGVSLVLESFALVRCEAGGGPWIACAPSSQVECTFARAIWFRLL
jgi:hypothetical protein